MEHRRGSSRERFAADGAVPRGIRMEKSPCVSVTRLQDEMRYEACKEFDSIFAGVGVGLERWGYSQSFHLMLGSPIASHLHSLQSSAPAPGLRNRARRVS